MRIIDLSVALKANIASDPPSMLPKIEYLDHKQGAQDSLKQAISQIDRAVAKGVFHRRTGSRYIARLSSQVAKLARSRTAIWLSCSRIRRNDAKAR